MTSKHFSTTGKKASIDKLPIICRAFAQSFSCLDLPNNYHAAYVDIMCRFAALDVPLKREALISLGNSYQCNAYPELNSFATAAKTPIQHGASSSMKELGETYGTKMPAAFYQAIMKIAFEDGAELTLFKDPKHIIQDCTYDSVLRAFMLVPSLHLHIQSILSQKGLRFEHANHCYALRPSLDNVFYIRSPDESEMLALMQSLVANMLEQYSAQALI
ncbi:MAG: hypothetical protein OSB62_01235 [Alphaproteobacteria bacterium]|nr:hypothetical protein [Alphaproteobacteria bacterium]